MCDAKEWNAKVLLVRRLFSNASKMLAFMWASSRRQAYVFCENCHARQMAVRWWEGAGLEWGQWEKGYSSVY